MVIPRGWARVDREFLTGGLGSGSMSVAGWAVQECLERDAAGRLGDPVESEGLLVWSARSASRVSSQAMCAHVRVLTRVFRARVAAAQDEVERAGERFGVRERAEEFRFACIELARACGVSEYVMSARLEVGITLEEKLPRVGTCFESGDLDWWQVRAFTAAVADLDPAQAAAVADRVLPDAVRLSSSRLRRALDDAVTVVTGRRAEEKAVEARAQRRVVFQAVADSMAEMIAVLPAEDAAVIQNVLGRLADRAEAPDASDAVPAAGGADRDGNPAVDPVVDGRTADQRRADALVQVFLNAAGDAFDPAEDLPDTHDAQDVGEPQDPSLAQDADAPRIVDEPEASATLQAGKVAAGRRGALVRRGRIRPLEVVVTVPLSVLLGLSDDPGMLNGYGLIPAAVLRDLATRATWRCAVVDDTHGTLLGLGRSTFTPAYRPGAPLSRHVIARDQTCRFPGCARSASTCEIDHLIPHPRGVSCECNTGPLCPRHHRAKHEAGWKVEVSRDPTHPPGSLIWTSPNGLTHTWLTPALTPGNATLYRNAAHASRAQPGRSARPADVDSPTGSEGTAGTAALDDPPF